MNTLDQNDIIYFIAIDCSYFSRIETLKFRAKIGYYVDAHEQLKAIPIGWTSRAASDPFVTMAAGRAAFRLCDLLALVQLIREIAP